MLRRGMRCWQRSPLAGMHAPMKRGVSSSSCVGSLHRVGGSSESPNAIIPSSVEATLHTWAHHPLPLQFFENIFYYTHSIASLPWYISIPVSTFLFRTLFTLPASLYQQKMLAKTAHVGQIAQGMQMKLAEGLRHEGRKNGWSYEEFMRRLTIVYKNKLKELRKEHGAPHPLMLMLLPISVQVPIFFAASFALRSLSGLELPFGWDQVIDVPSGMAVNRVGAAEGMSTEGVAWFKDLSAVDATLRLPIMVGLSHLINIEYNMARSVVVKKTGSAEAKEKAVPVPETRRQRLLKSVFRGMAIAAVPIATQFPAAVCIYWISSAGYSLLQNMLFRTSTMRTWFGYDRLEDQSDSTAVSEKKTQQTKLNMQ